MRDIYEILIGSISLLPQILIVIACILFLKKNKHYSVILMTVGSATFFIGVLIFNVIFSFGLLQVSTVGAKFFNNALLIINVFQFLSNTIFAVGLLLFILQLIKKNK